MAQVAAGVVKAKEFNVVRGGRPKSDRDSLCKKTIDTMRENPKVFGWLTMAAFTGPVIGATLSLFALQHTEVGIASTLIALPPVFLLPISWVVFKEKFDWSAVLGTMVAIGGVALLFLA